MNMAIKSNETVLWSEVKIKMLEGVDCIPIDLYIKLSDVKFVKVYSENDSSLEDVTNKYKKREVDVFYCKSIKYENLSHFLLNKNIKLKRVEKVEVLKELVNTFGVSDEVVKEIENIRLDNLKAIELDKNISSILNSMVSKGDFLSQHSLMVSFFSCLLAKTMDWDSQSVQKKLSFAGILHDMLLTSDILLKLKNNKELSWKEQKKYKNHIKDLLLMLDSAKEIPPDVTDIIKDHHEFSDEHYFSNTKSPSSIPQINALFILSDIFCHEVLFESGINLTSFQEKSPSFYEKYNKGNFKKPMEALKKIMSKLKI